MSHCTYLYRDPKTGVPVYVGKGVRMSRPYSHLTRSTNPKLGAMLKKRIREGYDPQPQVILASSAEDAVEMEILLIAMCGRIDNRTGTLFNLTDGGEGALGRKDSPERAAKRRIKTGPSPAVAKAVTELWADEEYRAKQIESRKAAWTDERRRKHTATIQARTPEQKAASEAKRLKSLMETVEKRKCR